MPIHPACFVGAFLGAMPFLTCAQQVATSGLSPTGSDFANRTFVIGEAEAESKRSDDVHFYFIFQLDGRATFRGKRGSTVLKDSPLRWQLVGDSLSLVPSTITLAATGKTQQIERATMTYGLEKVAGGYLLKRKKEQMVLLEVK
jgi:hypothetical protein